MNTHPTLFGIRQPLGILLGFLMAVVPLTSSFLVENLSLTLPWARWAHLLTPLVLGVAGIVIGTINVLHGYRWQGFLQLLLTIAAMLWAYLIAGFAIATSHGRGI